MGEFGFLTGDGVYHVTVYATDENGNYKVLSMKNLRRMQPKLMEFVMNSIRQSHQRSLTLNDNSEQKKVPQTSVSEKETEQSTATPAPFKVISTTENEKQEQFVPACSNCKVPVKDTTQSSNYQSTGPTTIPSNHEEPTPFTIHHNGEDNEEGKLKTNEQESDFNQRQGKSFSEQQGENKNSNFPGSSQGNQIQSSGQGNGNTGHPSDKPNSEFNSIGSADPASTNSPQNLPFSSSTRRPAPDLIHNSDNVFSRGSFGDPQPDEMNSKQPFVIQNRFSDPTGLLYKFNYTVGFHGHHEMGDQSGNKEGEYHVIGRDGIKRIVTYRADGMGFHPVVKFEAVNNEEIPREQTEKDNKRHDYEFKWFYAK